MGDYVIPKDRIVKIIGKLIHEKYPKFAKGKCYVEDMGNDDDPVIHYFNTIIYAKYHVWLRELELRKDLFNTLESYLDEEKMTFVLDWFNEEFGQDAESITF